MKTAREALTWLGWPGCLSLVLLCGVAWAEWSLLPAWHADAEQSVDQAVMLRRRLHRMTEPAAPTLPVSGAAVLAVPAEPEAAWALLWQALPTEDQRATLQSQVLQAAARHGLQIETVQYRGERVPLSDTGGRLWRQRMAMPVRGPYAAVRRWLADIQKMPSAAVDELGLERQDPSSDEVQAQVGVSLWWRQVEPAR